MTNHSCICLCNSQGWLTENLSEFATHRGNLGSGTFSCQVFISFAVDIAEPPVNELPERGSTEREATAVRSPPCSAPARGVSVGGAELTLHTPESTLCSQLLHWCGRQTATCPSWLHCYSSASLWRNWSNP